MRKLGFPFAVLVLMVAPCLAQYKFTKVDFPGAAQTEVIAINNNWQYVGASIDANGTNHAIYLVRERIGDFEQALPRDKFIRIHRSVIVNLDAILEIQNCGGGEYIVVLRSGKELPLGRTYRETVDGLVKGKR